MTIQFNTSYGLVTRRIVDFVREELMKLYQRNKDISRAEVYFEELDAPAEAKVCNINIVIFGDMIYVHRRADSYEQAARDALTALQEKIEELVKLGNEPADEITSTVKI